MPDPEDVLGVDRRVVRCPPRGDDDVPRQTCPQVRGDRFDRVRLVGEEAGCDLWLLEDLVAERHIATGSRPGNPISPRRARANASSESGRIAYVQMAGTPAG